MYMLAPPSHAPRTMCPLIRNLYVKMRGLLLPSMLALSLCAAAADKSINCYEWGESTVNGALLPGPTSYKNKTLTKCLSTETACVALDMRSG